MARHDRTCRPGRFPPCNRWASKPTNPAASGSTSRRSRSGSAASRAYDGIDVLATADLSSKLVVRLWPVGHEDEAKRFDIQLKQLVTQSFTSPIDAGGNQLLVIRSPGDKLRVSFHRSSLVFAPGETFSAIARAHAVGPAGRNCLAHQGPARRAPAARAGAEGVRHRDASGRRRGRRRIPMEIKLPDVEGVYELTLTAINAALRERLPWKRPIAERKVQLVIVADKPQRAPTADSQTLVRLVEIDPTSPHSWERLTQLMSSARKENLGSGDTARWDHPQLGPLMQLGSSKEGPGWEAYPLPISNPGQPHILEIEYPSDVPQTLGISLIEPNAAGAVMPIGLDSGVYVSDEDAESQAAAAQAPHRLLAEDQVAHGADDQSPPPCPGRVRQAPRAGDQRRSPAAGAARKFRGRRSAGPSPKTAARRADDRRLPRSAAVYRELFGTESLDAFSHRSLDDWNTFYQGAIRLIEYLNYAGYNGLMLTVVGRRQHDLSQPAGRADAAARHGRVLRHRPGPGAQGRARIVVPAVRSRRAVADADRAVRRAPGRVGKLAARERSAGLGLEWIGADGTSCAARTRSARAGPVLQPAQRPRAAGHAGRGQRTGRPLRCPSVIPRAWACN